MITGGDEQDEHTHEQKWTQAEQNKRTHEHKGLCCSNCRSVFWFFLFLLLAIATPSKRLMIRLVRATIGSACAIPHAP